MAQVLFMASMYALVMYFVTIWIYKRKGIEITRLEVLIRTFVSAAIFMVILYFLGDF